MKQMTHVYVQRVDPTTVARMRIPKDKAAAYIEGETLDVPQLQAELAEKTSHLTDDPFLLPEENERLTLVAAARGVLATFQDYPRLEHDQRALQARAGQIIELHVQIWLGITNDVEQYTHLAHPGLCVWLPAWSHHAVRSNCRRAKAHDDVRPFDGRS
jgi:hypothetical protein